MKHLLIAAYILLFIISILLIASLIIICKYELLNEFKIQEMTFPNEFLVYIPYIGEYSKMLKKVNNSILKLQKEYFYADKMCRIFYDSPSKGKECRAVIGCLVARTVKNKKKIQEFLKVNPSFKVHEIKDLEGLAVGFPLYNFLNYFVAVFRAYKKLIKESSNLGVTVHIFDYKNKKLVMAVPFLEQGDSLLALCSNFSKHE